MSRTCITVVRGGLPLPVAAPGEIVMSDDQLRASVLDGRIVRQLGRFDEARLLTERLSTSGRPMLAWVLRLLATGRCYIVDAAGPASATSRRAAAALVVADRARDGGPPCAAAPVPSRRSPRRHRLLVAGQRRPGIAAAQPVYLRTDLSFGVRAGGSVGHIAGVVNELAATGGSPILLTTAPVPTVKDAIEVHHVAVPERFWNFRELPTLRAQRCLLRRDGSRGQAAEPSRSCISATA